MAASMQKEFSIDLNTYQYTLPEHKIALEGTKNREDAKLLYYSDGAIKDYLFKDITALIPDDSTVVFNNTKVIAARIFMYRKTGAKIEIFLLKPAYGQPISIALESTNNTIWECIIGNQKKWAPNEVLTTKILVENKHVLLHAKLVSKTQKIVEFSWSTKAPVFAQILDYLGNTPLPPYIKRPEQPSDKTRYQTVYSKEKGAVAAPTAGLHFTNKILAQLASKNVKLQYLTLHVGAGTFLPIKSENVHEHPMHNETVSIPITTIKKLVESKNTIAVGTTSVRTLESLYWFGVKLLQNNEAKFQIEKLYPYQKHSNLPTQHQALNAILEYAAKNKLTNLEGATEIFIFPGYEFKICNGLITNFHQPESTLILLIAAFVGKNWRSIYNHALKHNYRFLSFGDSSFLVRT